MNRVELKHNLASARDRLDDSFTRELLPFCIEF